MPRTADTHEDENAVTDLYGCAGGQLRYALAGCTGRGSAPHWCGGEQLSEWQPGPDGGVESVWTNEEGRDVAGTKLWRAAGSFRTGSAAGYSWARALLQGGDVMVFDESFAALDPENLREALGCVLKRGRACSSSHIPD